MHLRVTQISRKVNKTFYYSLVEGKDERETAKRLINGGVKKTKKNSPTSNETCLNQEELGKPKSTKVEATIKMLSIKI
jgi:hypothetical protein